MESNKSEYEHLYQKIYTLGNTCWKMNCHVWWKQSMHTISISHI